MLESVALAANLSARYILNDYLPDVYPGTDPITDFGGTGEQQIRPPACAAFLLAAALDSGVYDEAITGISAVDARAQAVRLCTSLAAAHGTWGGTVPGAGQAALWAYLTAAAARLVWADLCTCQREDVEAMVAQEADRMLDWTLPFWKTGGVENFPGDTKSEEIAWNASVVAMAVLLLPGHVNSPRWMAKLVEMGAAAFACPADLAGSGSVNGVRFFGLPGTNLSDDGTLVNHGVVHPDYMVSAASSLWGAMAMLARESVMVPVALFHNTWRIAQGLVDISYLPGRGRIAYPQGNDWGTSRFVDKAAFDVMADRWRWAPGQGMGEWAQLHLGAQTALQARFATGQTFADASENSYGDEHGREMWVAQHLAGMLIALSTPDPVLDEAPHLHWSLLGEALAPKLWWRLSETAGTDFADSSGNGYTGNLLGSGTTLGVASVAPADPGGKAVRFAGASGVRKSLEPWMVCPATVVVAVRRAAPPIAEGVIVGLHQAPGGGLRLFALSLTTGGNAKLTLFHSTLPGLDITGSIQLADGAPHLIVLSLGDTGQQMYVDGVLDGSATRDMTHTPTVPLAIGARTAVGGNSLAAPYLDGDVDEVMWLPYAVDADLAAAMHKAWSAG